MNFPLNRKPIVFTCYETGYIRDMDKHIFADFIDFWEFQVGGQDNRLLFFTFYQQEKPLVLKVKTIKEFYLQFNGVY